jgi:cobalt-zinc-cadmium efflux system protein
MDNRPEQRGTQGPHHHHQTSNQTALLAGFLLITGFMIVEAVGGLLSNSLALLSDAGHMLSDSISLGLSFTALMVGSKIPANQTKTFGYRRFEILAALFNGVLLLVLSVWIIYEAFQRFSHPAPIHSGSMLVIAFIGLIVNIFVAWILSGGENKENLNVRSAFVHVLGDLLGSAGAIVAAVLIYLFGWEFADPLASLIVSAVIIRSGWQVLRDSINILMEGKPDNLDLEEIRNRICGVEGVISLHDMHIWTITSGFLSLSCHLIVADRTDRDRILNDVQHILSDYHLMHSTVQIEGTTFETCFSDCAHQKKKA